MLNREIVVEKLVKRYGDFEAVKAVSFQVGAGEIFGFLGPNGAGKSTVVKILTTLTRATAGIATVGGFNLESHAAQIRRITGVALQEIGLDPLMKSRELLILQARMFGRNSKQAAFRADELLELVKLTDPKTQNRRVGQYSGGMRRRLDLAMALVHEPRILFLDEPTTGLDPASRRDIWAEVRRLNGLGMTIFLTTQYLEEADELADHVAIINNGSLVAEGTPRALKAQIGSEAINVTFRTAEAVQHAKTILSELSAVPAQVDGSTLRIYMSNAAAAVAVVANRLQTAGLEMILLTLSQPTLDDVFLEVTGQRLAVEDAKRPLELKQPTLA